MLFNRGDPKSAPEETLRGRQNGSQAKFGKETLTGAHGKPNWVPYYSAQAELVRSQNTQALLRHTHPWLRYTYPQLRFKAAVAYVYRLKQNQRKGKTNPRCIGILLAAN